MTQAKSTAEVIVEMLTENTGRHFLDSGGAYGRNWEHNQGKTLEKFDNEEPATFDVYKHTNEDGQEVVESIGFTISLYKYLTSRLEFDAQMNRKFHSWVKLHDPQSNDPWLVTMQEFPDALKEKYDVYDVYTVNSYNGECNLSQTIQYVQFTCEGEQFILLQIHGGCDVRGGYTAPRAFRVDDYFGDWNQVEIFSECGASWFSDDGYNFNGQDFEDESQLTLDGSPNMVKVDDLRELVEAGKILVDDKDTPLCPYCGKPLKIFFNECY